jgi:hypothetical protein
MVAVTNICFLLLGIDRIPLTQEQRVWIRFLDQPVEWSIQFLMYSGICYLFYKQGRKKMELKKPTVSTIINSNHDLDLSEDEEHLTDQ